MQFRTRLSLDEFTRPHLLYLLGHNVDTGTNKGGPKIRDLAVELLHTGSLDDGLDDTNKAKLNTAIQKIKWLRINYNYPTGASAGRCSGATQCRRTTRQ